MTPTQRSELVARLRRLRENVWKAYSEDLPEFTWAADALESDALTISDLERKIGVLRDALTKIADAELVRHTDGNFEAVASFANRMIRVARSALSDTEANPPVKSKDA